MPALNMRGASPYEAVRTLVAQQKLATDDQDKSALRVCYARSVHQELVVNRCAPLVSDGIDDVMAVATLPWAAGKKHVHHVGSLTVSELPDGRMRARCYCLYVSRTPGRHDVLGYGDYDDECVFEDGAWKIASRKATICLVNLEIRQ